MRKLPSKIFNLASFAFRKTEKPILGLLCWSLIVLLPLWIYGLFLALGKMELNSIIAMSLFAAGGVYSAWLKIVKPIKNKIKVSAPEDGVN
jgi:hypothetical protein